MGDTVTGPTEFEVTVVNGQGQELLLLADGEIRQSVDIPTEDFTWRAAIAPEPTSGPLGTAWEVQTHDAHTPTTITNPLFTRP